MPALVSVAHVVLVVVALDAWDMTLDRLTRLANILQRWRGHPTTHWRIAQHHYRMALIEFWTERHVYDDDSMLKIYQDDSEDGTAAWCRAWLGYVPGIIGDSISFSRPEHAVLFDMRWNDVETR